MSRVGKKPIAIPEKVEVSLNGTLLTVKGPNGTLTREVSPLLDFKIENKEVLITPKTESTESRVMWGTVASHLKNMLEGVVTPFVKKLLVEGVGYKWEVKGDTLHLNVGYSHPIALKIPVIVKVVIEKGVFVATSIDKDAIGQFVAQVRSQRKPEPYKGKGIRYETEVIRRKQGKKTT
jgi:large subunit ribosomal protein L6